MKKKIETLRIAMQSVSLKWRSAEDLPSGKIPDEIFLQAGLAVFAFGSPPVRFSSQTKTFQILARAKHLARLLPRKIKHKSPAVAEDLLNGGQYRIWPQVASLTLGARGPASPYSPFVFAGTAHTQTRIRLRLSNPDGRKAVCVLAANIQTKNLCTKHRFLV
ncbi:MAG: hypothetical protein ACI4Q7_03755 [Candidatus Avelusimicrobium sp.]